MSLLEKLTLDDLDADQRQLAECIGDRKASCRERVLVTV